MKVWIKKVPLAICGIGLGIMAMGNLLQSYSNVIYNICGITAGCILFITIIKYICYPKLFIKDMNCPMCASVSGTFSATLILLSVYLKSFIGDRAICVWIFGILLHIILILYFTKQFVFKLQMKKVFASYFIVYVGIVVAAITSPAFGQLLIGRIILGFGFMALVCILFLTLMRYIKYPIVSEAEKPLFCIYAAPLSLCILGYLHTGEMESTFLLKAMLIVNCIFYICALVKAMGCLSSKFYPSYAALTFPFVVSALALKKALDHLTMMNQPMIMFHYVVWIEIVVAVLFVMYVCKRYLTYLIKN